MKQQDMAEAMGVDDITLVNCDKYETTPVRNQYKIRWLCHFQRLDFIDIVSKFLPRGSLSPRPKFAEIQENPPITSLGETWRAVMAVLA